MLRRRFVIRLASYVFLCVTTLLVVYPVLYLVLGAFTTQERFIETIFLPIPNTLHVEFIAWALSAGLWEAYLFTFARVVFYIAINLLVGLIGGYIFSKLRFPGKDKVFLLFLAGMIMPGILMLVPNFVMMAWWPLAGGNDILGQGGHGLIGDWRVLFIFGWVPTGAIFLFRQSFDLLPTDYEDAAKLDGASMFTIIFRVYGPLLKPPAIALIIIVFLGVWNEYLWPSIVVAGHPEYYPVAVRIARLGDFPQQLSHYGESYSTALLGTLLVSWPPLLVYLVLQRYFVQGMVAFGLKG